MVVMVIITMATSYISIESKQDFKYIFEFKRAVGITASR